LPKKKGAPIITGPSIIFEYLAQGDLHQLLKAKRETQLEFSEVDKNIL